MLNNSPLNYRRLPNSTSDDLINPARVRALGMINRWNGWLWRPYSVLEHSVIGAHVLQSRNYQPRQVLGFLLHDYEESEFGDLSAVYKDRHGSAAYRTDVFQFNVTLCRQNHLALGDLSSDLITVVDSHMAWAEHHTVAVVGDPARYANVTYPASAMPRQCKLLIETNRFAKLDAQIDEFWRIFNDCRDNLA